jgi:hypothetical protein
MEMEKEIQEKWQNIYSFKNLHSCLFIVLKNKEILVCDLSFRPLNERLSKEGSVVYVSILYY